MSDALPAASYPYLSSVHRAILNLPNCGTEDDLVIELKTIINFIGFAFYHYSGSFRISNNKHVQRTVSNLPETWCESHSRSDEGSDPIMELVHQRLTPMIWEYESDSAVNAAHSGSTSAATGVGVGAIFPIHTKNGDTGVFGFFTRKDDCDKEEAIDRSLGEMSLASTYFHEAMTKIVARSDRLPKVPLTRREIECLQLIANYKSNWVISRIFGTSEHAVVYYVRRLMWKLDAQNRHQAVERAAACGLI